MTNILLLAEDPSGAEAAAARQSLGADLAARVGVTSISAMRDADEAAATPDVIWIHAVDRVPDLSPADVQHLRAHTERGGGILLTLLATPLVVPLGLERLPPNERGRFVWHDDADPLPPARESAMLATEEHSARPRLRGVQGWGGHPLFDGLGRGTFLWRPVEGEEAATAIYMLPRWPVRGRVVGVERALGRLAVDRAVAWEYTALPGRVVCIGAYLRFSTHDASTSSHRRRLLQNAIYMLARRVPLAESWWPDPQAPALPMGAVEATPAHFGAALPEVGTSMVLTSLARTDESFILAGKRCVVLGAERSGITEIWTHPLCLVAGGIEVRIDGELPAVRSVEISPDQVVRHLQTPARFVEERVFVPEHLPSAVIEYRYRRLGGSRVEPEAPRIEVRTRMPLRLEPSIPGEVLHPLRSTRATADGVECVLVVGRDDRFRAMLNVEGRASTSVAEDGSLVRATTVGSLAEPLRLTVIGTVAGRTGVARVVRTMSRSGVRQLAASRGERTRLLRDDHISLRSPSASLDAALEWAKARLATHLVTAPGVGTASVAGYPARVWNGKEPVSHACSVFRGEPLGWTGLALLASGSFAEAQAVLEFFAQWQDITGEMPRQVSTAGVADYVSNEGSTMFLTLLAAFTRWTGDIGTAGRLWPYATRVLDHLAYHGDAADRDAGGCARYLAALQGAVLVAQALSERATAASLEERVSALRRARPVGLGLEPAESGGAKARAPAALANGVSTLADFAAHRGEQGFRRLLATSLSCFEATKGAFGSVEGPPGLPATSGCADDSGRAAMVVLGVVEGMLGVRPEATARRVHVTPHCPREWTDAALRRLRVGDAVLEIEATEGCMVGGIPHDGVSYRVRARPPGSLTLVLEHPVGGRSFERVLADGAEISGVRCGTTECPHVRVSLWLPQAAEIQFVGRGMT
jgi:hypothetical protein